MRTLRNAWLTGPALAAALACAKMTPSFAQEISSQDSRTAHSALRSGTGIEAGSANALSSTDNELVSLLKEIEEGPGDLVRDDKGKVISLALRPANVNDRALFLVSRIGSLQELVIQGRGKPETGEWTREGVASLGKLTNLTSLRVVCVAPLPALKEGVFEEICMLRGLRSLSLVAACPERSEYGALSNLKNLTELQVSYATNFGDAELCLVTNLVNLKSLTISFDAVSRGGTNVLSRMRHLTNAIIRLRKSS